MTPLAQRIAELTARRTGSAGGSQDSLVELPAPSCNPGALLFRAHLPATLKPGAPLVVALHGCTQTATGYARGTGWSSLADRHGFALLLPEQARANNPNLCFNWFQPADISPIGGEAESIAAAVKAVVGQYQLDRARVFVTGLSAGGAMAAVMLATYPHLFAGGAVIGGLPYGCASGVPQALEQMRAQGPGDDAALAAAVRRVSRGHEGPWPTLSLWHGTADATVHVSNMERLGRQWRNLHGLDHAALEIMPGTGSDHRVWRDAAGRAVVEEHRVLGMGHGVPLDPSGRDGIGIIGPFMLDAGIASTAHIAQSWGLMHGETIDPEPAPAATSRFTRPRRMEESAEPAASPTSAADSVRETIERALRSAGLMR